MLCEICNLREANIQYTEMVNGEVKVHHYCMHCASEMDFKTSGFLESDFPLGRLLAAMFTRGGEETEEETEFSHIECPVCHTTYEDFAKNSRFGCPDCYEVFDLLISDSIRQFQGSDTHKGKHPKYRDSGIPVEVQEEIRENVTPEPQDKDRTEKLMELKRLLRVAVLNEEFEDAARYRDEIRQLEAEGSGSGGPEEGTPQEGGPAHE